MAESSLLGFERFGDDFEAWNSPTGPIRALEAVEEFSLQWMVTRSAPRFVRGGEVDDVRIVALLL